MEKRCFACMHVIEGEICPHCGYNNASPEILHTHLLPPGTQLGDRFLVGVALEQNGEGATYLAFDGERQEKVRIREFFPESLCHRESDGRTVTVNAGKEIQYKALMTDFVELSRQLKSVLANTCLLHVMDIFTDFGTIYTVYEEEETVPLSKYLSQNVGELSWEETENLFLPLLYTIKLLNSRGIVHRGISPATILVTKRHELRLAGICTSAVRATNSEIPPELFPGYAAPEQYRCDAHHGEWTDVYAISAVLYKVLTGTTPVRANLRGRGEDLIPPMQLNPSIPRNVSAAIMNGLEPNQMSRTHSVTELMGELYATSRDDAPVKILNETDEEATGKTVRKKKKFRMPVWLIVILICLPIMLGLFFAAYYLILGGSPTPPVDDESSQIVSQLPNSSLEESSKEESSSSSGGQVVVENFVGQYYDDVIESSYKEWFVFKEKIEKFDDTTEVGRIIDQNVKKDSIVPPKTEIQFTVSKGPQHVTVVPYTDGSGMPVSLEDYKEYYTGYGVNVTVKKESNPMYASGEIIRTSVDVGDVIDREKSNDLIIWVAE